MNSENRNDVSTPAADQIISIRLNPMKDRDIIRALDVSNRSAEIKRIIRAYINFIGGPNNGTE